MEQEVNNFVRDARRLEMAKIDVAVLKYSALNNEDVYLAIEQIENIIADAQENLVGILNSELNRSPKNSFSIAAISDNISKAISMIESLGDVVAPGKTEIIEMLNCCLVSFLEKNFIAVLTALKQDQERFRQHKILLQDLCLKELLA